MNFKKILIFIRLFGISLYAPIGLALIPVVLFGILGALSYFFKGCSDFDACYLEPLTNIFFTSKTWKMLLLMWVVGVAGVMYMGYQNLKPEIHQWFRKLR